MVELSSSVFEKIFYLINNPALVITPDFVICDANDAAVAFLHYSDREDLIGTPVTDILVDTAVLTSVADRVAVGEQWVGETQLRTKDDLVIHGIGHATPITVNGETYLAGLFTDLTERQRYVHSLKILNRVLTHNIRNDINVILGYTEQIVATDHNDAETISSHADSIRQRLQNIVNKANTAKELEFLLNQKSAAVLTTIDLGEELAPIISTAESQYSDVEFSYPTTFESVQVVANHTISRVFTELIDNAVRYNDTDQPIVDIDLDVREGGVVVSVADNGPGIDPRYEDQIFGREEIDNLQHGEGLSLFFVDQVMRICGGHVWFEPNDPRGTVFKLYFSRADTTEE